MTNVANDLDELASRNNPEVNRTLPSTAVGIAGCGGLGSNVAMALARIGVGRLVLVDSDAVETSNLNRQQYFLGDIGRPKVEALAEKIAQVNPRVRVETHRERIGPGNIFELFAECVVVVEAFDQVPDKSMIIEAFADERFQGKYLVCASGLAGIRPSNLIATRRLAQNIYVCGDLESAPCEGQGLMAPRVMIAAGHQANMVVRILCGEMEV